MSGPTARHEERRRRARRMSGDISVGQGSVSGAVVSPQLSNWSHHKARRAHNSYTPQRDALRHKANPICIWDTSVTFSSEILKILLTRLENLWKVHYMNQTQMNLNNIMRFSPLIDNSLARVTLWHVCNYLINKLKISILVIGNGHNHLKGLKLTSSL